MCVSCRIATTAAALHVRHSQFNSHCDWAYAYQTINPVALHNTRNSKYVP